MRTLTIITVAMGTILQSAVADTTGPLAPTSIFVATSGDVTFTPFGTAALTTIDGTIATMTVPPSSTSDELFMSGFGAAVPAGATIDGIVVSVHFRMSNFTTGDSNDFNMGTLDSSGTAKTYFLGDTGGSYISQNFSTSTELWGLTLTPADVNSGRFGVFYQLTSDGSGTGTLEVDQLSIEIFYTPDPSPPAPVGLSVDASGNIILNGKIYRGIGVNYTDAFERTLASIDATDTPITTYQQGFADLKTIGIPYARIKATGFWPSWSDLYVSDKARYLAELDAVVASAESNGIGLIMSLFWWVATVPDIVGEPVNQWGNINSDTIEFMREYTETIVTRYQDNPTIWAWEFGNEFNLFIDVGARPDVNVSLGTPATRSAADEIVTADMLVAMTEFAALVRSLDPHRPITTGNSIIRPDSEDLRLGIMPTAFNTPTESLFSINLQHPGQTDLVSAHIYPLVGSIPDVFSFDDLMSLMVQAGDQNNRPVFIGEYGGIAANSGSQALADTYTQATVDAIVANKIELAAIWNFGGVLPGIVGTDFELGINLNRDRLDAIVAANGQIAEELSTTISSNIIPGLIEEGATLILTGPLGTNYQWKKDNVDVIDDPPRVTGANTRTLTFAPVLQTDAGVYTVQYDNGAKAIVTSDPYVLSVLAPGTLPAMQLLGAALMCVLLGAFGIWRVKHGWH